MIQEIFSPKLNINLKVLIVLLGCSFAGCTAKYGKKEGFKLRRLKTKLNTSWKKYGNNFQIPFIPIFLAKKYRPKNVRRQTKK